MRLQTLTNPILNYPNFDEPFSLTIDARAFAISAMLYKGTIVTYQLNTLYEYCVK